MSEYRVIMAGIVLVCGLAPFAVLWPVLDVVLVALVLALVVLAVVGYLGREAWRELRFRSDMRALDRRDTARQADARARVGAAR